MLIEWIVGQFTHFNLLTVIVVVMFTTILGRLNLQKQMKQMTDDIYKSTEQLKDEIREVK